MPVYRIPPVVVGPQVFLPKQVKDKRPWGLIERSVPEQWGKTKGAGVTVAVLDTGLWRHNDLPTPVFAWNATGQGDVYDKQGHGTHVAGIIGARLDGAGVVGWAPECNLGCVKVLSDQGWGDDRWIARGIEYAVAQGADILNMSLGGPVRSPYVSAAVREAVQAGVIVLCAAGNEGPNPRTVGYPAALAETIAIASYNKQGQISRFSSRGPQVDFAFPGEEILSTWPGNRFRILSGTSMATPAASGLAALALAANREAAKKGQDQPIRNTEDLRQRFRQAAEDRGPQGRDPAFGWGVVDPEGVVKDVASSSPEPATDDQELFTVAGITFSLHKHGDKEGVFVYKNEAE